MSKLEKLMEKARNNPGGLQFKEFRSLLSAIGWNHDRTSGSHEIWISLQGVRLSIQPKGKMAKGYQVTQFLKVYDDER